MGLQQPTNPGESARKHTATAAGPSRLEPPAKTHPVTCWAGEAPSAPSNGGS